MNIHTIGIIFLIHSACQGLNSAIGNWFSNLEMAPKEKNSQKQVEKAILPGVLVRTLNFQPGGPNYSWRKLWIVNLSWPAQLCPYP